MGWRLDLERREAKRRTIKAAGSVARHAWAAPSVARALPYTQIRAETLVSLARHTRRIVERETPGTFVECGVWRGGASFLIADVLRRLGDPRTVWMFDSYEAMPPAQPIDGAAALQAEKWDDPRNLIPALEDAARTKLGLEGRTRPVRGWFEQTLPAMKAEVGEIALLRLDCDWHASVTTCLEELYDQVVPGGLILIDDYYTFDGCAVAVHEFLARRQLVERITTDAQNAVLQKRS